MPADANNEADAAAGGGGGGMIVNNNNNTKANKNNKKNITLSKRAKRKLGPNPKNTWPQQPNIQSSELRSKAYLRVAGLSSFNQSNTPLLLDPTLNLHSPEVKFGRLLGSTDQRIRHSAVKQLQSYLKARCDPTTSSSNGGISELDLLKLWKGLWYTLYMADKVVVQQELAQILANLIWCFAGTEEEDVCAANEYMKLELEREQQQQQQDELEDDDEYDVVMKEVTNDSDDDDDEEDSDDDDDDERENEEDEEEEEDDETTNGDNDEDDVEEDIWNIPLCRSAHLASLFLKTFFITLIRDWHKMDKYRVDKFYTLMRLIMNQVYAYMAQRHWNLGIIRLFNDVIFEQVFMELQKTRGVALHWMDITLDELVKVNNNNTDNNNNLTTPIIPLTETTFLDVLDPYFSIFQHSKPDAQLAKRMMEQILSKFLLQHSVVCDDAIEEREKKNDTTTTKTLVLHNIHVQSIADFIFQVASDVHTKDRFRPELYGIYKEYMKRIKKVGYDVDFEAEEGSGEQDDGEEEEEEDVFIEQQQHDDDDEVKDDVLSEDPPPSKRKKSKKKNKKHKIDDDDDDDMTDNSESLSTKKSIMDDTTTMDDDDSTKKSKKNKDKKKKKKAAKKRSLMEDDNSTTTSASSTEEEPVRKKSKKAEKNKDAPDEVITISLQDQKKAKEAAASVARSEKNKDEQKLTDNNTTPTMSKGKKKKKNKKKDKARSKNLDDDAENKRVSFGRRNQSKSHAASMRDLKRSDPEIKPVTPEKSILRNKDSPSVVVVEEDQRHNANNKKTRKKQRSKRKGNLF